MGVSKTQIDRLGERLKGSQVANADLQLLDEYRRSFSKAHDTVVSTIRERFSLQPTGRPAKSTTAIVDKLRRESVRLSQIQDIAGCRLIVPDLTQQDAVVDSLNAEFTQAHVIDRRAKPSHGYRAVHVVVDLRGKAVEIQIRTAWQHKWAEFSEKCADAFGADIKYGGGDDTLRDLLLKMSASVALVERSEVSLAITVSPLENARELAEWVDKGRRILGSAFEEVTAIAVKALEANSK